MGLKSPLLILCMVVMVASGLLAAECVAAFKPAIVYPYHYRGSDLEIFKDGLSEVPEVEVQIRQWYPGS